MQCGSAGIDSGPGGTGTPFPSGTGSPSSSGTGAPSSPGTGTGLLERTELDESARFDSPWLTIVWNDPVNLMTYVTHVFRTYFGYSRAEAEKLMMQVHTEGRAVVASGNREEMERHVEAMHDYGLWATVGRDE